MKQKIKLLFRIRSMEMGGVQKVLISILNNLDRDKFEISLLLNLHQGKLLKDIPKDVVVEYLGMGKEFMSKNALIKNIQLVLRKLKLKFYEKFPEYLYKTKNLGNEDIEIAFFHYNYKDVLKSPNKKSKKIGWMHGDIKNITILGDKEQFVSCFTKFDKMIYVSKQTLESAKKFNLEIEKNAMVIYNPIEVEEIINKSIQPIKEDFFEMDKKNNIKNFISIGRVKPGKGYQVLYQAHKKLIEEGFFHKIYIIGEGDMKMDLEDKAKKDGLDQTFILLGERENPYSYIKKSNYFVFPSFSEAYPLVIAESLILGKPIITTDVGGIKEMMSDNENGIFVESKNEQQLYEAMKFFLEDKERVNFFMDNNKKYQEFFNPEKIYRQIENLFI